MERERKTRGYGFSIREFEVYSLGVRVKDMIHVSKSNGTKFYPETQLGSRQRK